MVLYLRLAWIGAKRFSIEQIGTFPFTNLTQQAIKILGIYFTYDTNLYFDKLETKLKRVFDTWKQRQLSIFGRKEIVGTLALSQVYYQIKYNSLIGPHDKGINIADIYLKIKTQRIKWVQKVLQNNLDKWKIIPLHYITKVIDTKFICSKFDIKCLPLNLPEFFGN